MGLSRYYTLSHKYRNIGSRGDCTDLTTVPCSKNVKLMAWCASSYSWEHRFVVWPHSLIRLFCLFWALVPSVHFAYYKLYLVGMAWRSLKTLLLLSGLLHSPQSSSSHNTRMPPTQTCRWAHVAISNIERVCVSCDCDLQKPYSHNIGACVSVTCLVCVSALYTILSPSCSSVSTSEASCHIVLARHSGGASPVTHWVSCVY